MRQAYDYWQDQPGNYLWAALAFTVSGSGRTTAPRFGSKLLRHSCLGGEGSRARPSATGGLRHLCLDPRLASYCPLRFPSRRVRRTSRLGGCGMPKSRGASHRTVTSQGRLLDWVWPRVSCGITSYKPTIHRSQLCRPAEPVGLDPAPSHCCAGARAIHHRRNEPESLAPASWPPVDALACMATEGWTWERPEDYRLAAPPTFTFVFSSLLYSHRTPFVR